MFLFIFRDISAFGSVRLFPEMAKVIGVAGTFVFNGIVGLIGVIVVFFFLPETKGLTLTELQHIFEKKPGKTLGKRETQEDKSERDVISVTV